MKIKKGVDGRKHKRFQVKEGINAVLHNDDHRIGLLSTSAGVGFLSDILMM